jgi:hypothetical protein
LLQQRRPLPIVLAALATSVLAATAQADSPPRPDRLNPQPEPPGATASAEPDRWRTRIATERYTPERLGLARDASVRQLARAAIDRSAGALGLRSRTGITFASELQPSPAPGAHALHMLRFQQTAGGRRVLWSEIDVAVSGGKVTSISATTVPFGEPRLQGRERVSRARATAIAKRALAGAEHALPAQPVAYAGTPARPRPPRRAWVVQLEPARQPGGADDTTTVCIVVDATSGKILMRYRGFVGQAAQPRARSAVTGSFAAVFDAGGTSGFGDEIARWNGDPREGGVMSFVPIGGNFDLRAASARAAIFPVAAVLGPTCKRRQFCAGYSVVHGKPVGGQTFIANSTSPFGSHYSTNGNLITLKPEHADDLDIIAHEFGHRRDRAWADDRVDGHQQVDEVEEALADMFAYDLDFDPTIGDDRTEDFAGDRRSDGLRTLEDPHDFSSDGIADPARMSEYRCAPDTDEHINATILGHAYYRYVDQVGHDTAGNVLTYIPYALPASPSFSDVAFWFAQRSLELYGPAVRDAAVNAFRDQVGIGIQTPAGAGCPRPQAPKPASCPPQKPACFGGQSPPTRLDPDPTG